MVSWVAAAAPIIADAELRFTPRRADIMAMPVSLVAPRYTVAQVKAFPRDGNRYELVDGVLLVSPAPRYRHQVIVSRLLGAFLGVLGDETVARVVAGELEVGDHTLMDPDLLVIPAGISPETHWKLIRTWWLAVEVLSPSTRLYDQDFKRPAFQAVGVDEVWLVDPDARNVSVWLGTNPVPTVHADEVTWRRSGLAVAVTVDLEWLFRGLEG